MPNSAAGAKVPAGKQGRSIGESSPGGVSLLPDLAAVIAPSTPGRLCQQWKAAGADAAAEPGQPAAELWRHGECGLNLPFVLAGRGCGCSRLNPYPDAAPGLHP